MAKVSVIVPNYNHGRYLRQRLDSILAQTLQDFELILLDDHSPDDSRCILSEYAIDPRVRMEFNEKNSGSTFKQWNKGVRLARGEYVWIAESDDYAEKGLLKRLVEVLDSEPKAAFAYCRSSCVSENDEFRGFADSRFGSLDQGRWEADFLTDGVEECRNYLVYCNTVPNSSAVLFRRAIYESVGGADEGLFLCGDWKLWGAMALTGRVAYVSEPLNYFRVHEASVRAKSNLTGLAIAEALRVVRWMLDRVTPGERARERLCDFYSHSWVPAILSTHVPIKLKWGILRDVIAVDPRPMKRMIRPAIRTVGLKLLRHTVLRNRSLETNPSMDTQGALERSGKSSVGRRT